MDVLKRLITQIQAQVADLSVSQKLLIGTLLLVIPMMLWVVATYSGSSAMLPVLDQPMDEATRTRIVGYLQSNQIRFEQTGNQVLIPAEKRPAVIAQLALSNLLPSDTSEGFKKFLAEQSWWWSEKHRSKYYDIALQNHLSSVISEFPWVRDATVMISRPAGLAFARPKMSPTASVQLTLETGRLNQRQVRSVADLVSGAVAEMRTKDVNVIDAVAGRSYTVDSEMGSDPGAFLETVSNIENYFRRKIEKQFQKVAAGIQVGVNVDVDMTRSKSEKSIVSDKPLLVRSRTQTTETRRPIPEGGPTINANTGMSIPGSGTGGAAQVHEEREEQFTPHPGYEKILSQLPAGMPKRVSAALHVPRTYFIRLFKERNPGTDAEPTEEQLAELIDKEQPFFRNTIKQVLPITSDEQIYIGTYSDTLPAGLARMMPARAPGESWWSGTWLLNGMLVGLAVFALAAMVLLVRRAASEPLPSAHQLAGIPELVGADETPVGDVEASSAPLPGVELDERTIQHKQLVDQVADMSRSNPKEVASLLKWWMRQRNR
ncbi:MAG: hypothetical protein R3236_00580 [Phycisphaeraceae bacterium]|nr:hypothetical protein [Phycisphaeraceae bacterium]